VRTARNPRPTREVADLRARLADAEQTLRAIRNGEVDAVVVAGKQGPKVFTLQGAEHAYRVLIESMNEGALTLTAQGVILYANRCFAQMVNRPLELVLGSSFCRFLSASDQAALRPLLARTVKSGAKVQVSLIAGNGRQVPAHLSIRPLPTDGDTSPTVGIVVTDMTEARRAEEVLRALTHRVVQAQEAERGRVALELHDGITQLLCAILLRCQALGQTFAKSDGPLKRETMRLREMLGTAAEEVERISRNLRPGVLEQLGLVAVLRDTGAEFALRTGVSVKLCCVPLPSRLPADTEVVLYRILQEALRNIEQHARARHVTVKLSKRAGAVHMTVQDDGIGFDSGRPPASRKGKSGLGLFSMRERATYVGGVLTVNSARRAGTEVEVCIPLPPEAVGTP
jgi:PAS domain S-box-containing protein